MAESMLFTDGWAFQCVEPEGEAKEAGYTPVELPHDWQIYDASNLYRDGDGWYRKVFALEKKEELLYRIYFEGAYMDCTVWVNACMVGEWKYGYSSFYFDITEALCDGENTILVRLKFRNPNSRWYSGAGLYRNVWLKTVPKAHILQDGLYVSARQGKESVAWTVELDAELMPAGGELSDYELLVQLFNAGGALEAEKRASCADAIPVSEKVLALLPVKEDGAVSCRTALELQEPKLWDVNSPALYTARVALLFKGSRIDTEEIVFGCRTCEFSPERGFVLNGRSVKLNGVCEHHDFGALGAVFHPAAARRKFDMLRAMGVNAIRTSHNMPAPKLLEMADALGFLIVDESFDMWERSKTEYDYARFFKEWVDRDVAAWVRRDRNHPCVIMWSVGNEIYDTHADEQGARIIRELMERVMLHDRKQNARPTIASNYMQWENAQKCADIIKLAGYNYAERLYDEQHEKHPDWVIYGSETSSTVQSRGIYHFPLRQPILKDEDEQCSSLGNSTVGWGAKSTDYCIEMERDHTYSMGQFLWTGFDYIGEPTPYQTKNSYFGQIDTAGFPKDSYYRYQAEWTDFKKSPMVHVFPYWDFNDGQLIDVQVASNAPLVELFVNGVSQGKKRIDHEHGDSFCAYWQVPYHEGNLLAVAYDEEGREAARDEEHSFGDAVALSMESDREGIDSADDLAFLTITAKDKDGFPVKNANNRVQVKVEGAGRLVGLDNGDSTDYDSYKGSSRRMFSGKLLAIIAPVPCADEKADGGEVRVTVTSKGLAPAELIFHAAPLRDMAYCDRNTESEYSDEIPVRKLELRAPEGKRITRDKTELVIEAAVKPENADCQDIEWRVTDAAGIDMGKAKIEVLSEDRKKIKVTVQKNGDFYVRAACKNGGKRVSQISQLEIFAQGLDKTEDTGSVSRAYEALCAAACDEIYGDKFKRGEEAVTGIGNNVSVVFRNMDFGKRGTRTIRICGRTPLWRNSIHIRFYDGEQEIRRIVEFGQCEDYEEQTFLFEKVTGLKEVTFIFLPGSNFDFRGFEFVEAAE